MEITIKGEYIQMDQLLKKEDLISSGGMTAVFLSMHEVLLNGVEVIEKRKKIHPGDILSIDGIVYEIGSGQ